MALTNPSKLINVQELDYFENKLAQKYATKTEAGVTHASAATCEGVIDGIIHVTTT